MDTEKKRVCIIFIFVCVLYITRTFYFDLKENESEISKLPKPKSKSNQKVWISMGLCYSHNTQLHGKSNYPYRDVTPLALFLWKYFLPEVSTIIQVLSVIV